MTEASTHVAKTVVDRAAIASALYRAFRERTLIDAPSTSVAGFAAPDALDVAERLRVMRIAGGDTPVGYKVGFTNAAVRDQFGAGGQLAATVYRETLVAAEAVEAGTLLLPRIEPEVVVGIGAGGEVAWVALGFEIVQSHVADWQFSFIDAIADFGLHAALVVGKRVALDASGIGRLDAMRVELRRNGEVVERGAAADVDGGARGSLRWLRDDLRRVGRALSEGELVTTGSMTRVPAIAPGECWTLEALGAELPPLTIATT